MKHLGSGLLAPCWQSLGIALPGFGFEYWKEPSGMELGLEEPQ